MPPFRDAAGLKRRAKWPASGRSLINALRRLAPNLRQAGISIEFTRESSHSRRRLVSIASEASEMPTFADVSSDAVLKASSDATPSSSGGSDASDDVDDKDPELLDGERLEAENP